MEQRADPPVPDADRFAAIAPFYDLDLAGYEDDIAFYLELVTRAASAGARVLELGCGTGRVAIPLAAAGLEVHGVDLSASMLELARARAADAARLPRALGPSGAGSAAPTFSEGDMRGLDLGSSFGAVLIPLSGLQHMTTAQELTAALRTVARHLQAGGVAIVDIEAPHADDFRPGPRPLVEHWTRPWRGGQVTKLVAVDNVPAEGVRHVTFHYDEQPPGGPLRRSTQRFTLRVITPGELELAAQLAGLAVTECYGDYELSPFEDGHERLVAVLEHDA